MESKLFAIGTLAIIALAAIIGFGYFSNQQIIGEKTYNLEAPLTLRADAKTATSEGASAVEMTIYQVQPNYYGDYYGSNGFNLNTGLALIKEQRSANLASGLALFQMKGTAQYLESTSLHLKDLTDSSTQVLEQNYQYDLISSEKLMEKYLDKEVEVVIGSAKNDAGNAIKETVKGKLLSFGNGLVLQTATGVVTLKDYERINYPVLPQGLITSPTVEWLIQNNKEGKHDFQVSYLASGLNWNADYVAVANSDDSKLDITGWVSIKNLAGTTFENAKLKLVAGDVNLVRAISRPSYYEKSMDALASGGAPAPQFTQENLFEYHLYTLQRPATLKSNEDKQITLFDAKNTPIQKQFVYEGGYGNKNGYDTKIKTKLIFENSKANNLGQPMPKGKVRVYKADSEGQLQFVGEDQIDHTPENEKVRLFLGNAFDIVAEKKQTGRKELGTCSDQQTYAVEIRNHKKEAISVVILQDVYGEASIISESIKGVKETASQFSWNLPVSADGSATLTYTVQQEYC